MTNVTRMRPMLLAVFIVAACRLASASDVVGPEKSAVPVDGIAAPASIAPVTAPVSLDPVRGLDLAQPAASASGIESVSAVVPQAADGAKAVLESGAVLTEGAPGAAKQAAAEVQGAGAPVSAHAGDEKAGESWLFDKQQGHGQAPDGGVMDEAQLAAYLAAPEHTPAKKIASSAKMAVFDSGDYRPEYEAYLRNQGYDLIRVLNPTRAEVDRFGEEQGFTLKSEWLRWLAPTKPADAYIVAMEGPEARHDVKRLLEDGKDVGSEFVPLTEELYDAWYPVYAKHNAGGGGVQLKADWAKKQLADPKAPKWQISVFRDPNDPNRVLGGVLVPLDPVEAYIASMEGSDARRNLKRRLDASKGIAGEFVPLTEELYALWYPIYAEQFSGDRVVHLGKDWARQQLANPKAPKWQIIVFHDPTDPKRILGGAIAAPVPGANRLSLGYAGYDESEYARKFQLSVRTFAEGLKVATAQKLKYISYGADRSRFDRKTYNAEGKDDGTGFDFAALGLLEYKSGVRMTAGPEEGVMLEKDLVSEGRGHEFFVLGLKRQGPHMDAYYAARERGEKPEIDSLTGPLLEPGSMTPSQMMQGHHFSKGGSKVRSPREIDVTEHVYK